MSVFKYFFLPAFGSLQATPESASSGKDSKQFLAQAMQDSLAEIEVCNLALEKASDDEIKAFSQQMIDDHSRIGREIEDLANRKGVPLPHDVTSEQRSTYMTNCRDCPARSSKGSSSSTTSRITRRTSRGSGNSRSRVTIPISARSPKQSIFSGSAGGHLGALSPLIGEVMGVRSAKIDYRAEGRKYSLKVDDVASADVEAIEGLDGGEVTINNPPFTVAPDVPLVIARSTSARYDDHGIKLDISGKNGFYSPFTYQAA